MVSRTPRRALRSRRDAAWSVVKAPAGGARNLTYLPADGIQQPACSLSVRKCHAQARGEHEFVSLFPLRWIGDVRIGNIILPAQPFRHSGHGANAEVGAVVVPGVGEIGKIS